jgi:hypothetical protein
MWSSKKEKPSGQNKVAGVKMWGLTINTESKIVSMTKPDERVSADDMRRFFMDKYNCPNFRFMPSLDNSFQCDKLAGTNLKPTLLRCLKCKKDPLFDYTTVKIEESRYLRAVEVFIVKNSKFSEEVFKSKPCNLRKEKGNCTLCCRFEDLAINDEEMKIEADDCLNCRLSKEKEGEW